MFIGVCLIAGPLMAIALKQIAFRNPTHGTSRYIGGYHCAYVWRGDETSPRVLAAVIYGKGDLTGGVTGGSPDSAPVPVGVSVLPSGVFIDGIRKGGAGEVVIIEPPKAVVRITRKMSKSEEAALVRGVGDFERTALWTDVVLPTVTNISDEQ